MSGGARYVVDIVGRFGEAVRKYRASADLWRTANTEAYVAVHGTSAGSEI